MIDSTVDYGYGEATPDKRCHDAYENSKMPAQKPGDAAKYEYEEVFSKEAEKYCYGEAAPDTNIFGYVEASPDFQKYGYEEVAPCPHRLGRRSSLRHEGAPRRSSIGYTGEIENILPSSGGRPIRRRTSISFDGNDEVKEVQPMKELAEDPKQLWFQNEEYNLIREKAQLLTDFASASMEGDNILAGTQFCFRGLESHINAPYIENEQVLAWKSVFFEQYYQRTQGGFDEEVVARLYEMASMASRARALERAKGDFEEAVKHNHGIRTLGRRRHSTLA